MNSTYAKALDSITAVIILTVSLAIIYYVTVLFTEIYVLGTADGRKKSLKASKSGLLSSSKPVTEAEFDPGIVSTQVNPNFMKAKIGTEEDGAMSIADLLEAIKSTKEAPTDIEMWNKFKGSLQELKNSVNQSEEELHSLTEEERLVKIESEYSQSSDKVSKTSGTGARRVIRNEVAASSSSAPLRTSRRNPLGDESPSLTGINPMLSSGRRSGIFSNPLSPGATGGKSPSTVRGLSTLRSDESFSTVSPMAGRRLSKADASGPSPSRADASGPLPSS